MSDVVIRVENLSKKYVIGRPRGASSGDGLRHALQDVVTAPFRRIKSALATRRVPAASAANEQALFHNPPSANRNPEEFYALRDISFEVKRGEVLGIIGRNGAGKSTLLKILSRITEPTTGRIGLKGRVASLLEVGTGFHPELTGRENIYLNGAILGMSRAEVKSKIERIVEFSEIGDFIDTPVKRYSSGMYVRLAVAVAAHLEADILFVDEILSVADAEFQRKCLGKLSDSAALDGRTVFFVSHALHTVQALCPKAIWLHDGRIHDFGTSDSIISRYNNNLRGGNQWLASNIGRGVGISAVDCAPIEEGKALRVKAKIEIIAPVNNCGLGFHILAPSGAELCDLRPETVDLNFGLRTKSFSTTFEIRELSSRLASGSYTLCLSLHETNLSRLLERTPVAEFVVPAEDYYGTNYPPRWEKDGAMIFPVKLISSEGEN